MTTIEILRALAIGAWVLAMIALFRPMAAAARGTGDRAKAMLFFVGFLMISFNLRGLLAPDAISVQAFLLATSVAIALLIVWIERDEPA